MPREERETYEQFFNRMQGLTSEIVKDPAAVELDAFAKKWLDTDRIVPAKSAMDYVASDNVDMAQSPYEIDEKDLVK